MRVAVIGKAKLVKSSDDSDKPPCLRSVTREPFFYVFVKRLVMPWSFLFSFLLGFLFWGITDLQCSDSFR